MTTPKRRRGGYPLPTVVDPPTDVCYVIHVPDDPAYRQAFWQSYEYLTRWVAWKRDQAHTATLAAQRMKESLVRTWDTLDTIGDICELEINVTCGSACCNPADITITIINDVHVPITVINAIGDLPGGQADNGTDVPSPDWPDYAAYQADKCRAANALVDDYLSTLQHFSAWGNLMSGLSYPAIIAGLTSGAIGSLIAGLLAMPLLAAGGVILLLGTLAAMAILGPIVFSYFEDVYLQMDRQALLCAAYNAPDAASAQDAMLAEIDNAIAASLVETELEGTRWIAFFATIQELLLSSELLEIMFDQTEYVSGLVPGDCSLCTGVPPGGGSGMLTNLEHMWELEEASGNRNDSHGTAHLTTVATPAQVAGAVGFGMEMVRANAEYAYNLSSIVGPYGDVDWTLCFWVKPYTMPAAGLVNNRTIMMLGNQNSLNTDFICYFEDVSGVDKLRLWTGGATTSDWHFWNSEHSFVLDQWHMVVIWRDAAADTINIQVNNSGIDSFDLAGSFPTQPQQSFYIGVTPTLNRFMDGVVDQVSLWARTLTPLERTWLFNNAQGRAYSEY